MKNLFPLSPILIVDDEPSVLKSFEIALRTSGMNNIIALSDSRQVAPTLKTTTVEVLILDLTMPFISGEEILKGVSQEYPHVPVIVVTGLNDVNTAVECMKSGAVDYLVKPIEKSRLISSVRRTIEIREWKRQYGLLKEKLMSETVETPEAFSGILTKNKKMVALFHYLEAVSRSREPILVTGETGVGKELFAESIHKLTDPEGPFVTVNGAGLDDTMFTDTLFGHKRGAYTDAVAPRKGLVETATGGTLFIDEIGDLSHASQVKLLRLIQEKEYYPLGSDVPKYADTRIVVATNRDLARLMEEGTFRKDLFFRLSVHTVQVPPLRDRLEDLDILVDFFLEEAAKTMGKVKPTVPKELFSLLSTYSFPGNVRELRSMVYDAVGQHQSKILSLDSFKKAVGFDLNRSVDLQGKEDAQDLLQGLTSLPTIREMEETLVREALRRSQENQSVAARLLGISRQALNSRLNRRRDEGEPQEGK